MSLFPQDDSVLDAEQKIQGDWIRRQLVSADSKARYAESLFGDGSGLEVSDRVEPHLKAAMEGFYRVGQLMAAPQLATEMGEAPFPSATPALQASLRAELVAPISSSLVEAFPAPSSRGLAETLPPASLAPLKAEFDPWMLTDPEALGRLQREPRAWGAIEKLWDRDPSPSKTIAIHWQLKIAFDARQIAYAGDAAGKRVGCSPHCPWSPIYVSLRDLVVDSTFLRAGDQFFYDVAAEGSKLSGAFRRRIVIGNFAPVSIKY